MEPQAKKEGEIPLMWDELTDQFKLYANTMYELYLLKTVQKISSGSSRILVIATIAFFAILLIVFVSIGTALWLNQLLGNSYCGFFIVSGFYALVAIVLYALRNAGFKKSIQNVIICEILKD
jgi:hypothetical protein